jgi:hypothetical protein
MSDTTVSFDKAAAEREPTSEGRQNDRSTIDFPYLDLDAAVEVAQAVYGRAGLGACEIDELAAQMGQTVSGAFRAKTATAKLFSLVDKDARSSFKLSAIGQKIVRAETEAEGRAAAFLAIPLYKAIFERYRGHLLPPTKALEREMTVLGVAPKQADKARQAFERSARQAGFFTQGEDRLVQPRFDRAVETRPVDAPVEERQPELPTERKGGGGRGGDLHPFIEGLLKTLPPPETEWKVADQAKWLQTAASIFGLIYKSDGGVEVKALPIL